MQLQPDQWRYVNEGRANIVFAYSGNESAYLNKVIRISKNGGPSGDDTAFRALLRRLVPAEHQTQPPTRLTVNTSSLLKLLASTEHLRPQQRRDEPAIDLAGSQVHLMDNVFGSGVAVEIKPKWGFIPSEQASAPPQLCRYCMHSVSRDHRAGHTPQRLSHRRATYCPLDLFSPHRARSEHALERLWQHWLDSRASSNNFRVFVDSQLVMSDELGLAGLRQALACTRGAEKTIILSSLSHQLTGLKKLAELQREHDGAGIVRLWAAVCAQPDFSCFLTPATEAELRNGAFDSGSSLHGKSELRKAIIAYAISATFKDCSLAIQLPPSMRESSSIVKWIDLDCKPLSRLPHWARQAHDMRDDLRRALKSSTGDFAGCSLPESSMKKFLNKLNNSSSGSSSTQYNSQPTYGGSASNFSGPSQPPSYRPPPGAPPATSRQAGYVPQGTYAPPEGPPPPDGASSTGPGKEDAYAPLRRYDTVFLVDDSESMEMFWDETRKALTGVVEIATRYDDDGCDLVFFNSTFVAQGVKSSADMIRTFRRVEPRRSTPTATALRRVVEPYLLKLEASKASGSPKPKPLNIVCLTDGAPNRGEEPDMIIVDAAKRLDAGRFPLSQLGISFIQIGTDDEATQALEALDDQLRATHKIRDMVDTTPYDPKQSLTSEYLLKAIMGGISRKLDNTPRT
ncbi:uncharacterized protein L969DRAFT_52621 [Mixia osmundae IAM 14324]|uniref:VWFA domain-containing protein n=1 Tax=Mixia osmundae (strain CBS 9802 / IAM 14324 / JCM 22182 / KY 12970) TaxID=764103 RepID=G7DT11_MIXOS|nr:uncharacterized protein L969DRAFT_52621 [Mixia osmundae IAM 14324]KEI37579.1 hypothetical protein L969DRAFT_52621 [Mixia osmundae IAM 14324]GAA93721.1 hypothetical protein E5Q_00367 [Mixia osmundae IAM 14324]